MAFLLLVAALDYPSVPARDKFRENLAREALVKHPSQRAEYLQIGQQGCFDDVLHVVYAELQDAAPNGGTFLHSLLEVTLSTVCVNCGEPYQGDSQLFWPKVLDNDLHTFTTPFDPAYSQDQGEAR